MTIGKRIANCHFFAQTADSQIVLREPKTFPVIAHLPDGNDVVLDANIYDNNFVDYAILGRYWTE